MRLGVQIAGCVFVCGVGSVRRAVRGGLECVCVDKVTVVGKR